MHQESTENLDAELERAVAAGDNLIIQTLGSDREWLRTRRDELLEAGYTVHLLLMDLPAEEAAARAATRYAEAAGTNGPEHFIGSDWTVDHVGDAPRRVNDAVKDEEEPDGQRDFASYGRLDFSVPRGEEPRVAEHSASTRTLDEFIRQVSRVE